MGSTSIAQEEWTTAVGTSAYAQNTGAIALGAGAYAVGQQSIAIGHGNRENDDTTKTRGQNAIAIGTSAEADEFNSVAIGAGAKATLPNQIVLGTSSSTVYIPGNLVVGGELFILGPTAKADGEMHLPLYIHNSSSMDGTTRRIAERSGSDGIFLKPVSSGSYVTPSLSDRRLKNVGDKYTAGLAELKKLDFFHYTFKDDKDKTPRVGVIAQDLEKVFPDAVTKGEDGYLRIRWEDMFYAVMNAVKELDNRITEIVQNITDINTKLEEQIKVNEEQAKVIEAQAKTIEDLAKRIEKLEKE